MAESSSPSQPGRSSAPLHIFFFPIYLHICLLERWQSLVLLLNLRRQNQKDLRRIDEEVGSSALSPSTSGGGEEQEEEEEEKQEEEEE